MSKKVTKDAKKESIIKEEADTEKIVPAKHYDFKSSSLFCPTIHGMKAVPFTEISYFKSKGNDTELHRVDKNTTLVQLGLCNLEADLQPEDFMRISNTIMVNLHEVAGMNNDNPFCVIMKKPLTIYGQPDNKEGGEVELDGSPKWKAEFLKRLLVLGPNIKRR